jgi:hypothetical protein
MEEQITEKSRLFIFLQQIKALRLRRKALGGGRGSGAAKSPEWAFS